MTFPVHYIVRQLENAKLIARIAHKSTKLTSFLIILRHRSLGPENCIRVSLRHNYATTTPVFCCRNRLYLDRLSNSNTLPTGIIGAPVSASCAQASSRIFSEGMPAYNSSERILSDRPAANCAASSPQLTSS